VVAAYSQDETAIGVRNCFTTLPIGNAAASVSISITLRGASSGATARIQRKKNRSFRRRVSAGGAQPRRAPWSTQMESSSRSCDRSVGANRFVNLWVDAQQVLAGSSHPYSLRPQAPARQPKVRLRFFRGTVHGQCCICSRQLRRRHRVANEENCLRNSVRVEGGCGTQ
jgi:hypothetical protein